MYMTCHCIFSMTDGCDGCEKYAPERQHFDNIYNNYKTVDLQKMKEFWNRRIDEEICKRGLVENFTPKKPYTNYGS
jgi:hypothetical protein